ncbi:AAA domain-containing protein [Actinokineospora sp. 24-640]
MFSPQQVPKVDRGQRVYAVVPGEPLPWEPGHPLAKHKLTAYQAWRHVVYLGVFPLEKVFELVASAFTPDPDSYDERPGGESALAAFAVDGDGRAVADSLVLSSCAWATGKVMAEGPGEQDWAADFNKAAEQHQHTWWRLVTSKRPWGEDDDGTTSTSRETLELGRSRLADTLAAAVEATGLDGLLPCSRIRVQSTIVARRNADSTGGHDFLNSFVMADLDRVAGHVARGEAGAALGRYLRPVDRVPVDRRVDVRERVADVFAETAPDRVPAGRWPANTGHALALNQQLAVNRALGMPEPGVVGVNGPPGTGKTTMLRDLVAGLLVARARALATLRSPDEAFTATTHRWRTGKYPRSVEVLRPDLTGFEIVVASANNGAVENITDEIPGAAAVDESWREAAEAVDYFPHVAASLLASDDGTPAPAWALVAARLGNKANRTRFVQKFWYHENKEDTTDPATGLLHVLQGYAASSSERSWAAETALFRDAEAAAERMRLRRQAHYESALRLAEAVSAQRAAEHAARLCDDEVAAAAKDAASADAALRHQQEEADRALRAFRAEARRRMDADTERAEGRVRWWRVELAARQEAAARHETTAPGFLDWLRSWGAVHREWRRVRAALAHAVAEANHQLTTAHHVPPPPQDPLPPESLHAATAAAEAARRRAVAAARARQDAAIRLASARELVDRSTQEVAGFPDLGAHAPDAAWWGDRERRERAALWTDSEWNQARTEVLLAALRLHKAFLRHVAPRMRRNLQAAMDVVGGEAPRDLDPGHALAAWQHLFLVVPVVSTTFASYARLFGHLREESLGWLLVDEAGQSTPQNAVGALWRTRHAVVVGDPLQLEPVTTLPFKAEQAIRAETAVACEWSPSSTSVQRLADRQTEFGTLLSDGEETTWVGAPLTVHRRCDQPMFAIVNQVAYDGLMIDGTAPGPGRAFAERYPSLPPSKWIDVTGGVARGHWIPEEGHQLDKILAALVTLRFDMRKVMAVGPFRDIARELRSRTTRHPGLTAGTIHTAQGKQADIVVLVLGGDPAKPGSRRWAASKPNLLNVAVSRAKHRLYVIGDRAAWSSNRYFDVLAANLPHSHPVGDHPNNPSQAFDLP